LFRNKYCSSAVEKVCQMTIVGAGTNGTFGFDITHFVGMEIIF
jgi:hypothetical protein